MSLQFIWLQPAKLATCVLLLLAGWGVPVYGESIADEFIKKITAIESMQAKFVQEIKDQDGAMVQSTSGDMKVVRPGKFFWKVAPPYEQWVVGNTDSLVVYDPDLEQATVYSKHQMDSTPAIILSGDGSKIKQDYDVKQLEKGRYQLTPLDQANGSFETLLFTFKGKKVSKLVFNDKLGQTTSVSFSKVSLNKKIDDSVFSFAPPPGTDIIVNE